MARRELSDTLKNLKFMQRAAQKEESKKEEVKPIKNFVSPNTQNKKCMVIMEGNPHPGALKGRMSFQNFNPSIDKLNEEAVDLCHSQAPATSSGDPVGRTSNRENGSSQIYSESSNGARTDSDSDGEQKRKH